MSRRGRIKGHRWFDGENAYRRQIEYLDRDYWPKSEIERRGGGATMQRWLDSVTPQARNVVFEGRSVGTPENN